ncbi:MAG: Lrp/AsnC family transcriptional regulator [Candidatus Woesearchaeota archaeon]
MDKDKRILEILKQNSKLTTSQISKKTNIPITTVHNRIKKMEKSGLIISYSVVLDYKKAGRPIAAYILVNIVYALPSGKKIQQEDVAKSIKKLGNVEEVSIIAGGADILVKVRVKDVEELNDFVVKKLRSIDGVDKTQTMIILSSV